MPRVPKLEPIAARVWLLRGGLTATMNAYLIEDGDGVVVYDTGEKGMACAIAAAAERMGGLKQVVLGHADTDHRGAAPALSALAPVVCHPDAVADAQGAGGRTRWDLSKLPPAARLVHHAMHRWVWDGGPVHISGTVREGDEIAGFRVIELPGHAPGQIGLWRAADRVALVSDCFYMTTMWGRPTAAHVPHEAYNLDTEQARRSVAALAALDPLVAAPGHLGPLTGGAVASELERVAGAGASRR
ncbi:MAG TPA: MBL fold metallo-hydrolase [Solirubrobacteraceae bacterium]|jgi:glyoxylase-like metal-dependent hydrolase (beta-lactamase superfamily II)|nr:MBL fold metallo-hydrolase [Solirubrobacteraceae bacterium]